ncbi:MAG: diguanylate cyclase [Clostridiales bacterium]|nr:diguanylate cyclase [Clostridiales bacterium]
MHSYNADGGIMSDYDVKNKQKERMRDRSLHGIKFLLAVNLMILLYGAITIFLSRTGISLKIFIGAVVCTMAMTFLMIVAVLLASGSRVQASALCLLICNYLYLLGVLAEVTSTGREAICVAIKLQYFSMCSAMLALTWFVATFINVKIPVLIYVIQYLINIVMMGVIWNIGNGQLFYRSFQIDLNGETPRLILEKGPFFYIFYGFIFTLVSGLLAMCLYRLHKSSGINRIRIRYVICGICCPIVNMSIRFFGLSKGYDISYLGILGEVVCFFFAFIKYGYFNSIQVTNENILKYAHAGILVVDEEQKILFQNDVFKKTIRLIQQKEEINEKQVIERTIQNKSFISECQGKTYEITADEIKECGYTQGYMLWLNDITEHYAYLEQMKKLATTDGLTGLNNRNAFQKNLVAYIQEESFGAFIMMDIDNFKIINDTYGHATGDAVLQELGNVISEIIGTEHYACRIGGDEFSVFFCEIMDPKILSQKVKQIADRFSEALLKVNLPKSLISFGISILNSPMEKKNFEQLYREADRALYLSKNQGKNRHCFYGQ